MIFSDGDNALHVCVARQNPKMIPEFGGASSGGYTDHQIPVAAVHTSSRERSIILFQKIGPTISSIFMENFHQEILFGKNNVESRKSQNIFVKLTSIFVKKKHWSWYEPRCFWLPP